MKKGKTFGEVLFGKKEHKRQMRRVKLAEEEDVKKIKRLEKIREEEKKLKKELQLRMLKNLRPEYHERFLKDCGIKNEAGQS